MCFSFSRFPVTLQRHKHLLNQRFLVTKYKQRRQERKQTACKTFKKRRNKVWKIRHKLFSKARMKYCRQNKLKSDQKCKTKYRKGKPKYYRKGRPNISTDWKGPKRTRKSRSPGFLKRRRRREKYVKHRRCKQKIAQRRKSRNMRIKCRREKERRRRSLGIVSGGRRGRTKTPSTVVVGDMIFTKDQVKDFINSAPVCRRSSRRQGRNTVDKRRLWPGGLVKFELSSSIDETQKAQIRDVLQNLQTAMESCIRFEEVQHGNRILVKPTGGSVSYSMLGYTHREVQDLSLSTRARGSTIEHEFLHAIGVEHTQTRSDRDSYVKILWDNIQQVGKVQNKVFSLKIILLKA